ncbi:hypothetical protein AX14_012911 [Amanita brunnescens Koide BX004]|nr:hypothetical protein AX14_012911 [Amanita brunnescens Koide BX004]
MASTFRPLSSSHRNASGHICPIVMIELLRSISGAKDDLSDTLEDLPTVLQRAICIASLEAGCQFCPKARDIVRIADRIQIKSSTYQLEADRVEFRENLPLANECHTLKELLQSIMDIREQTLHHAKRGYPLLARDNQFEGANFTNIVGNYKVNSISNTFIVIKQESGVSVIVLLILAFLFFRLLL